ncbi:MAG: hypothetical protein JXA78_06090 [Anaerolineales bacterium]|nr:hypothetical protein [Anaerolineales bacterium]
MALNVVHRSSIQQRIARLWPLLIPLALFLPALAAFPYPSVEAKYSDLALAHYPYATYLRQAIWEQRRLPTWSPLILSGSPFAPNPLSGLWYPLGWLALLLPLPFGFNLTVMLHVLWGGLGMYSLLREEKLSHWAALFGALAFEAMPKLYAHYGAGHLTLLYALPWTPWLLWGAARGRIAVFGRHFAWGPAVALALIFLADVRWAAYASVLWWAYSLAAPRGLIMNRLWPTLGRRACDLLRQTLLAALLAAPLGLPLLEFVPLSSRSRMTAEDVLSFSLPPSRLLGLIFPDFGGFHEYMIYAGGIVLALGLLALFWLPGLPGAKLWAWAAGGSLLFSLGSFIPGLQALTRLPGLGWLRVPSRALFVYGLAVSALAAYAAQALLGGVSSRQRRLGGLPLVALAGFTLALAAGVWVISGGPALNFAWGSGAVLLGCAWIGARLAGKASPRLWYAGLLGLCFLDWVVMDRSLFAPRPVGEVFAQGRELAQYLASREAPFRVYSPSYSLPQQTAANYGIQLADGVDPLQLQSYVDFMRPATGVPWTGYSVTVPAFGEGAPASANAAYLPDPGLLGLLNVRYVAAEFDLQADRLKLLARFGDTRLYENLEARPRAWMQPNRAPDIQPPAVVHLVQYSPERIELLAEGPGKLVLSELAYPGWRVRVDGEAAPLELANGLLRSVTLESGIHQVVFDFRPLSLYLGLALCLAAVLFVAGRFALDRKEAPKA